MVKKTFVALVIVSMISLIACTNDSNLQPNNNSSLNNQNQTTDSK